MAYYLQHDLHMISGIDLSESNGRIDRDLISNEDVNFLFLRATEGLYTVDSQFSENITIANEKGIPVGAYHWLLPELHVGQQADLFFSTIKDFQCSLPPVVSIKLQAMNNEDLSKNVQTFMRLLEQKLHVKPIIYTSEKSWQIIQDTANWGCDYPLWIDQPGKLWPKQVWPWAGWAFWQHSYQASMPGIQNEVGMNWFNGSKEDLRNLIVQ